MLISTNKISMTTKLHEPVAFALFVICTHYNFALVLHENALVFSQSEVRNFSMYIITRVIQPIIFQSYWSCNGFWKDQHVGKFLECFFGVIITFVFNCRSVLFLMPCISLHHLDLFRGMILWVWSRSGKTMDLSCIERLYPSVVLQQT